MIHISERKRTTYAIWTTYLLVQKQHPTSSATLSYFILCQHINVCRWSFYLKKQTALLRLTLKWEWERILLVKDCISLLKRVITSYPLITKPTRHLYLRATPGLVSRRIWKGTKSRSVLGLQRSRWCNFFSNFKIFWTTALSTAWRMKSRKSCKNPLWEGSSYTDIQTDGHQSPARVQYMSVSARTLAESFRPPIISLRFHTIMGFRSIVL